MPYIIGNVDLIEMLYIVISHFVYVYFSPSILVKSKHYLKNLRPYKKYVDYFFGIWTLHIRIKSRYIFI